MPGRFLTDAERERLTRVSGHLDLCISRMELEVVFTLRRNMLTPPFVKRSDNPSPWCITEVCKPDHLLGFRTRIQSSSSQRWRYGATARSRRTIASIIWD
jgi:hypothetical protein